MAFDLASFRCRFVHEGLAFPGVILDVAVCLSGLFSFWPSSWASPQAVLSVCAGEIMLHCRQAASNTGHGEL